MFGIETLGGTAEAVASVGLVLVEALVLYVGYGTLTRVAGPAITEAVSGE
jgi:hypothetical protein